MEVARAATAGADGEVAGQVRFRPGRERRHLLVPHMQPGNLSVAAQRVREAVQAVADEPVDPGDAGRGEGLDHPIGNRGSHPALSPAYLSHPLSRHRVGAYARTAAPPPGKPSMPDFRTEADSLGEVQVPADRLWGAQTQRSLEHFSIGSDLMPRGADRRLRPAQESGGDRQSCRRAPRCARARPDRPGRRRDSGGPAPGHVSAPCLDDGQRHAVQHERERGDREPCEPDRRHAAGQQDAAASQRPREHVAVVERHVSLRDAHRRGDRCRAAADPGGARAARRDPGEGGGLAGYREDRPHPHAGCDSDHARAGVVGLRRHARRRPHAPRRGARRRLSAGARRHRGRHRRQRRAGLRRGGDGRDCAAHRPALRQRAEQVRRAGRA